MSVRPGPPRRSLQTQLGLYTACIIAAALICMSVLLLSSVNAERRSYEHRLLATARAVSASVDQRLVRAMALNDAVATSDPVQERAWDAAKARAARLSGPSAWMIMVDEQGRQVFNTNPTARQVRAALPLPENIQTALRTGRTQISNLIFAPGTRRYLVAIDTPVQSHGSDYVLGHMLAPEQFLADFSPANEDGALVTMVDRNHKVIARSRHHQRFVGAEATPDMKRALAGAREGIVASRSLEGEASVAAFTESKLSGWTTMVVVPRSSFETPLYRGLLSVGLVALLAILAAVTGARLFFRTISQELRLLEADAISVGHGEPVERRAGLISNFAQVQAALSVAARELEVRADRQRLMINELNHRVKNTLATVQSLAAQTFRGDDPDARSKFEERLASLAGAHDLLTNTNWGQVELTDVVARCGRAHDGRISAAGPSVTLQPQAALALCMCLHELTTNSLKYGALSSPAGRVEILWTPCPDADRLRIEWREAGGPTVEAPRKTGFGTRLIDRLMRHELSGEAERRFEPRGMVVVADISLAAVSRWRNDFDQGGD